MKKKYTANYYKEGNNIPKNDQVTLYSSLGNQMLKNLELKFVIFLPIFNAVANVTTNYYKSSAVNPGSIRAIVIIIFLIYFFMRKQLSVTIIHWRIFILIFYFIFLVFLGSNIPYSGAHVIKVSISLLMYVVGFYYINDHKNFYKLNF